MSILEWMKGFGKAPECPMCEAGIPTSTFPSLVPVVRDGAVVYIRKEVYDKIVTLVDVVERQELIQHAQRRFRRLRARLHSLKQHRARKQAWDKQLQRL